MSVEILSKTKVGGANGGIYHRIKHTSTSTKTDMIFGLYLPKCHQSTKEPTPILFWLSGLTCDDTNFANKAGSRAFEQAEKEGIAIVMPDTSPRGDDSVPNVDSYDLGKGAGFYVDATEEPYTANYQMYTYITKELPDLLEKQFRVGMFGLRAICGHSMGGHGALTIALKTPDSWVSVSAFSPICNPTNVPWGQKAFKAYLGSVEAGTAHDATCLLTTPVPQFDNILIEQGTDDEFLLGQLTTDAFFNQAKKVGQKVTINMRKGFDHSYHFIAAFIADHVAYHGIRLRKKLRIMRATYSTYNFTATQGKPIKCKAMIAKRPQEPLSEEMITVDPPQKGEVRVKVIANSLCHTDINALDGQDPRAHFPCILGHEAGCIVESVGEGVTSVQPGDHVIPCYVPQCCEITCDFCQSTKSNMCPALKARQSKGVMLDGAVRFHDKDGNDIHHFMGCSTMVEYTVIAEISCAKVSKEIALDKACFFGCSVSSGLGAVWNTCKVEVNSTVAVFGLGAVGLAAVQGAKLAGAAKIIAVDTQSCKFDLAKRLGATHCINPEKSNVPVQKQIAGVLTKQGVDYSFDCTGNVKFMPAAHESCHKGWGTYCLIGVSSSGHEVSVRPPRLETGKTMKVSSFGGFKSRADLPKLVAQSLSGEIPIDDYSTHVYDGINHTNDGVIAFHRNDCHRCVIRY